MWIFDDGLEGFLEEVCCSEVEISSDADDSDCAVDLFFWADDGESTFGIEGVFDEVGG